MFRASILISSLALGLGMAGVADAQSVPPIRPGEPYRTVRLKLLDAGFVPHRSPGADTCRTGDGVTQVPQTACFPEVVSCAGTGEGNCLYTWERSGRIFEVITAGEPPVFKTLSAQHLGTGRSPPGSRTAVPTECRGNAACWHTDDASLATVAYGIPETGAQPLQLECASRDRVNVRAIIPLRRDELVEDGDRMTVSWTVEGRRRELVGTAVCGDGCRFTATVASNHPLIQQLRSSRAVTLRGTGETITVPGLGAAAVVVPFLAACAAR